VLLKSVHVKSDMEIVYVDDSMWYHMALCASLQAKYGIFQAHYGIPLNEFSPSEVANEIRAVISCGEMTEQETGVAFA
jgi:hypothetical protein